MSQKFPWLRPHSSDICYSVFFFCFDYYLLVPDVIIHADPMVLQPDPSQKLLQVPTPHRLHRFRSMAVQDMGAAGRHQKTVRVREHHEFGQETSESLGFSTVFHHVPHIFQLAERWIEMHKDAVLRNDTALRVTSNEIWNSAFCFVL